jgi:uncharacterized membrane protein
VLVVALFFFCGGIGHFIFAEFLVLAMPSYLPFHLELIYISGFFELVGAIGILIPQTRLYAAYGLITLSVAVFPANINMAINAHLFDEIPSFWLYLRLPLQAILIAYIWWAVSFERIIKKNEVEKVVPTNTNQLESVCREFVSAFKHLLTWKWDERFQVALAEFGVDKEEAIHSILEKYLQSLWDVNSIKSAPASIRAVIDDMGGLKSGQLLFTSESIEGTFIYCMLWPWGNQKTISIRISPLIQTETDAERLQQIQKVKEWFGINASDSGWIKIDNGSVPTN